MKVWKLAFALLWHMLHWRGGDDVYVWLDGLPAAAKEEMDRANWAVTDMDWTDDRDHYVSLTVKPERWQERIAP